MNILHVDEQTSWRGGEQQASYLIRGLVQRGHRCVIAGRRRSPFLERDHGASAIERVAAPFAGEVDLWTAWVLARAIRSYAIDIIHAHTSHALSLALLARMLGGRARIVASRRVDFSPRSNALSRWKYAGADRVIAISERIADVMRSFGAPSNRLCVVHSGIDPSRFDVDAIARESLGVPNDVPLIGNVAALVGHKDHATLIDAFALVLRRLPGAHLVIAGEGGLRGAIEAQIERLKIGGSVHMLGYRDDVPSILRALDVYVMSSKEEGLGTSILDAMACDVPVVATAGGGIPELIKHEKTGLLAPVRDSPALADAIVRMLADSGLRSRVTDGAGALLLERFTVDRMVEGNLRVYESVLYG